jgi:adenylate cyclase
MVDPDSPKRATLFADVAGSTRIYERFGDVLAHAAIERCLDALKRVTADCGGRTIKTIGDELMAVFPSAEAVCEAAIEMQWRVMDMPLLDDERIAIRIGFHYGTAVDKDGDVFGDSVNVAARLTEVANPRQIITSAQVIESLPQRLATGARRLWPVHVKGKAEPVDVFEVMWDGGEGATVTLPAPFELPRIPRRMRLLFRGSQVAVDAERPVVSIGRDAGNELVVDARNASRVHARLEWRRDKFVLIDLSTNGTYVLDDQNQEIRLRREEYILDGDGIISFGRSHHAAAGDCVQFYCEYAPSLLRAALHEHAAADTRCDERPLLAKPG